MSNNESNNAWATFLLGAALGAAAGILLAPYAGDDARKKLMDKANDLKDQLGNGLSDLVTTARNKASEYGEKAQNVADSYTNKTGGNF